MSRGNELSNGGIECITAVAAAAFAIHSIEESEITRPRRKVDYPETSSFPKIKIFEDDNHTSPPRSTSKSDKIFRAFTNAKKDPEEPSGEKPAVNSEQQKQKPKENRIVPSPPAVNDDSGGRRTEIEKPLPIPRPPTPPISRKPPTAPIQTRPQGTKADLWEITELAKIQERYQKVDETISYWESKKKEKAIRKFEASQVVGTKRSQREKGRKKFEEDMEFIKQIAGEARTKAHRKKKNEILKANQKADIIRKTGDLPVSCYCC
ncbi:actin cytoskeleton-regulatory complex protein PAN1-like isoform X2 [Benincasa hispida]|nr:actin cytoskeleton-regulatory complex protein PAN1-like isoform X2 [Benincasa hispida]